MKGLPTVAAFTPLGSVVGVGAGGIRLGVGPNQDFNNPGTWTDESTLMRLGNDGPHPEYFAAPVNSGADFGGIIMINNGNFTVYHDGASDPAVPLFGTFILLGSTTLSCTNGGNQRLGSINLQNAASLVLNKYTAMGLNVIGTWTCGAISMKDNTKLQITANVDTQGASISAKGGASEIAFFYGTVNCRGGNIFSDGETIFNLSDGRGQTRALTVTANGGMDFATVTNVNPAAICRLIANNGPIHMDNLTANVNENFAAGFSCATQEFFLVGTPQPIFSSVGGSPPPPMQNIYVLVAVPNGATINSGRENVMINGITYNTTIDTNRARIATQIRWTRGANVQGQCAISPELTPAAGATLVLTDCNGIQFTATSDVDGNYSFFNPSNDLTWLAAANNDGGTVVGSLPGYIVAGDNPLAVVLNPQLSTTGADFLFQLPP